MIQPVLERGLDLSGVVAPQPLSELVVAPSIRLVDKTYDRSRQKPSGQVNNTEPLEVPLGPKVRRIVLPPGWPEPAESDVLFVAPTSDAGPKLIYLRSNEARTPEPAH